MHNYRETNTNCDCKEDKNCGCEVLNLGTSCSMYDGEYLSQLDLHKQTNVTEVIGYTIIGYWVLDKVFLRNKH